MENKTTIQNVLTYKDISLMVAIKRYKWLVHPNCYMYVYHATNFYRCLLLFPPKLHSLPRQVWWGG